MNCEKCNSREATVHLTEIISNIRSEVHLCDNCAKDIGLNKSFCYINSQTSSDLITTKKCSYCGTTNDDIDETGLVGCMHCYDLFKDEISSIVGELQYSGPYPNNRLPEDFNSYSVISDEFDINEIRKKLHIAVSEERYEDAAIFRDILRQRENDV
jgi:protein arginine kinase activator